MAIGAVSQGAIPHTQENDEQKGAFLSARLRALANARRSEAGAAGTTGGSRQNARTNSARGAGAPNTAANGAGRSPEDIFANILARGTSSDVTAAELNGIDGISGARSGKEREYFDTFQRSNPNRPGSLRNRHRYTQPQLIVTFQEAIDIVNAADAGPANNVGNNPPVRQPVAPRVQQPVAPRVQQPVAPQVQQPVAPQERAEPQRREPDAAGERAPAAPPRQRMRFNHSQLRDLDGRVADYREMTEIFGRPRWERGARSQTSSLDGAVNFMGPSNSKAHETKRVFDKLYDEVPGFRDLVDEVIERYGSLNIVTGPMRNPDGTVKQFGEVGEAQFPGNSLIISDKVGDWDFFNFNFADRSWKSNENLSTQENNVGWLLAHEMLHNLGYQHNSSGGSFQTTNLSYVQYDDLVARVMGIN